MFIYFAIAKWIAFPIELFSYISQQCSITCGAGVQKRDVKCMSSLYNRSNDNTCDPRLKPRPVKICRPGKCSQITSVEGDSIKTEPRIEAYWRTGLWGKVSK